MTQNQKEKITNWIVAIGACLFVLASVWIIMYG
jgi:uncharacterized membrane protein YhiD involved in acid resistance